MLRLSEGDNERAQVRQEHEHAAQQEPSGAQLHRNRAGHAARDGGNNTRSHHEGGTHKGGTHSKTEIAHAEELTCPKQGGGC